MPHESKAVLHYDPAERAAEKARSREDDQRSLESGEMSREQMQVKNGLFAFPNAKILFSKADRLY